jgi:uncharacterized circularly permuted ATP-grasp superfamily protein
MLIELKKSPPSRKYLPHLGYIGNQELKVPNYLFTSKPSLGTDSAIAGYAHCRELVELVLSRPVEEQHRRNQALTNFLRKREMTFSKLTKSGEYRIFNVPCTTTPLPLPKSLFDTLERSAQVLVASLRLVLQDIYGSQNARKSAFVQSLPENERASFINAIEKSPQYFPQLHDPVMRQYPFFDVVGLDLVLTEDLGDANARGPRLVASELPFRLLEINAGSPSGASNNLHILEGLKQYDPEVLGKLGRVMPNDHFDVLGTTYKSLGESWTGVRDGVQIILPPGGESGAAPEIHQLATYSGMIYADPGQLYRDSAGSIRLRTVSGDDPVVTAIYSRINSDSALFDLSRNLLLRDAETGKPLYLTDPLSSAKKPKALKNARGEHIPLESNYTVPGAIEAIHDRKIYVGGLNRVLDNKIILDALCKHAPQFFKQELQKLGLDPDVTLPVSPPETLPSVASSIPVIEASPEDWVIKSPNLSGGKGVYILKTLSQAERKEIIAKAKASPKDYAYQKLVRIGRIPIAKPDSQGRKGARGFHFANIAADIRMWAFYGAGAPDSETSRTGLPRLTHNGLIRTAPVEKGALSSIVNTSKGGGYAPMVVVDDIGHPGSVAIETLTQKRQPAPATSDLPHFVGAQLVQVAQIVGEMREQLRNGAQSQPETLDLYSLCMGLKKQCREILSFLHPSNMESLNEMIETLERGIKKTAIRAFFERRAKLRVKAATALSKLEGSLQAPFFDKLDGMRALNAIDEEINHLSETDRAHDRALLAELKKLALGVRTWPAEQARLFAALGSLIELRFPAKPLSAAACHSLQFKLETFCLLASEHLAARRGGRAFADLFAKSGRPRELKYDILFADAPRAQASKDERALIATEEELRTGFLLADTALVAEELRAARADWLATLEANPGMPGKALETARRTHFAKHPVVAEYQRLIDEPGPTTAQSILEMLEIMPYAKYNVLQFARTQGVSPRDLFVGKLTDRRVALLSREQRADSKLSVEGFAGECFAQKRRVHGMFSDSDICLWTARELSSFIQAYTVGHELIHFHQIRVMMEREQRALKAGPLEVARFLAYYGCFLGLASGTIEASTADTLLDRKPMFGYADLQGYVKGGNHGWVSDLKHALREGSESWNRAVSELGAVAGYSTDISVQVKVKAIREVIPALENAKNIAFAEDLGLKLPLDKIRSVLPAANARQRALHAPAIERQLRSAKLDWETLRLVACHQYAGVRFPRRPNAEENLALRSPLTAISLCGSYNQTQQQQ